VPARSRRLRGTGNNNGPASTATASSFLNAAGRKGYSPHAAQICFEWNTAVHAVEYEGEACRRALGLAERLTSSIQT
jgi:hypothetical protein